MDRTKIPSIANRNAANFDRRTVLRTLALACAATWLSPAALGSADDPEEIKLWPGDPPLPRSGPPSKNETLAGVITHVDLPRLRLYRPVHPNGSAVLVIGGGGYVRIELTKESTPTCQWLQQLGVTAFELIYRLPGDGWPPAAPLADGQRAMRLIRAQAGTLGLDQTKLGLIGFSAGGHLAGMTAVEPDAQRYPGTDAADTISARPAGVGLIYPVLTLRSPDDHTRTGRELIGASPSPDQAAAWSVDTHVDRLTPPTFLAQAADDPVAPIDNSLLMFAALRKANVPVELHVFEKGGHGWGLGPAGSLVSAWPNLFLAWARNSWMGG